jgi:DNA-binding NarL/FixJ family response regulator
MSGAAPDHAVRILLMDNHRLFASALHARLEQDPRFDVVGVVTNGEEAVRLIDEVVPDIVLLDAESPRDETLAATRLISNSELHPRVLILAGGEDQFDAGEAQDAGAAAFLRKPRSAADLLETLELATVLIQASVPPGEPGGN